jgi:hypothetical protein
MEQLATSKIDEKNRTYIPKEVLDILPKGDRLSWELDEYGNICVFMGSERFIRKTKTDNEEVGHESH